MLEVVLYILRLIRAGFRYYLRVGPFWLAFSYIVTLAGAGIVFQYSRKHRLTKLQIVALILQIFHLTVVFVSTVLSRSAREAYSYNLDPFWGEKAVLAGLTWRWLGLFANTLLLCPMGILLPMISRDFRWRKILTAGFMTSFLIEILQLLLKRGYFETSDLLHNTLGVMIGYWLYLAIFCLVKRCQEAPGKHRDVDRSKI